MYCLFYDVFNKEVSSIYDFIGIGRDFMKIENTSPGPISPLIIRLFVRRINPLIIINPLIVLTVHVNFSNDHYVFSSTYTSPETIP